MSFTYKPAVRDHVPLLIAIAGGTGSGKTLSGLLIARGICGGDDNGICFLDTEGERGKQYAPLPGQAPGPFTFGMRREEMAPPFHPDRYAEAALAAAEQGAKVLVIDSMSHEYIGEGGISDMHLAELERMATNREGVVEAWRLEKMTAPAWKKPKRVHKAMMNRLIQKRCHIIFCLRAEPKIKFVKTTDERTGRENTQIVDAGWQPICEKQFMFEMTCSFMMDQAHPGVALPIKLNEQHKPFFPEGERIGVRTGELLVAWSRGAVPTTLGRTDAPTQQAANSGAPRTSAPAQGPQRPSSTSESSGGAAVPTPIEVPYIPGTTKLADYLATFRARQARATSAEIDAMWDAKGPNAKALAGVREKAPDAYQQLEAARDEKLEQLRAEARDRAA